MYCARGSIRMLATLLKDWKSCSMESVGWYALSPLTLTLPLPAVLLLFFFSQFGTWNAELERLRYPPLLLPENSRIQNDQRRAYNIRFYLLLVLIEEARSSILDLGVFVVRGCCSIGEACSLVPALPTTLYKETRHICSMV